MSSEYPVCATGKRSVLLRKITKNSNYHLNILQGSIFQIADIVRAYKTQFVRQYSNMFNIVIVVLRGF